MGHFNFVAGHWRIDTFVPSSVHSILLLLVLVLVLENHAIFASAKAKTCGRKERESAWQIPGNGENLNRHARRFTKTNVKTKNHLRSFGYGLTENREFSPIRPTEHAPIGRGLAFSDGRRFAVPQ